MTEGECYEIINFFPAPKLNEGCQKRENTACQKCSTYCNRICYHTKIEESFDSFELAGLCKWQCFEGN